MSTEQSALWSGLHTLELTRQFTSPRVEVATAYHTTIPGKNVDEADRTIHRRHQKLASALALIGASSPDAQIVTAFSVELSFPGGSDPEGGDGPGGDSGPVVVIRLAQNGGIVEAELVKLRSLVARLVHAVTSRNPNVWAVKDERYDATNFIIRSLLLPTFRHWHADFVISEPPDSTILTSAQVIIACTSDCVSTVLNTEDAVRAIAHAFVIADQCTSTLEHQWATYDSGEQVDGGRMDVDAEEDDDRESLDPEEMKKSSIYRFVQKLSRYYVACAVITSGLVALVRSGAINIEVETVPISITTSTPAKENEYPSLESFLKQRTQIDVKSLDPLKVGRLRDSWPRDRESQNLFLHAEMQIALFYALNPQLCPIQGFIGVSKKCCWCYVCGSPVRMGMVPQAPLFCSLPVEPMAPNAPLGYSPTLQHIKRHSLDSTSFDKVCRRFKLVRRDLEDALVDEVNVVMGQLQIPQYESDSSGMSGPAGLGGYLQVLKADKEALDRKRKRDGEGGYKNKDGEEWRIPD